MKTALRVFSWVTLAAAAIVAVPPSVFAAESSDRVELRLDASQAEATLAIAAKLAAREVVSESEWTALFATEPYLRLEKREASFQRPFSQVAFREFAAGPALASRLPELRRTLDAWKRADLPAAARRILPYLPAEARIRATVYPVVKPRTNSFVFETATDPAIFLYLDPAKSEEEFANTVAHELHHVGLASLGAAYDARLEKLQAAARKAAEWMGAFGEGLAMLAAAGSADADPVAGYPLVDRLRWEQDMASVDQALRELDQFFVDVVEGGFAAPEVADHVAFTFFGYRGPWYTVGYRMGALIERQLGRAALVECMADPRLLLARYNEVARRASSGRADPLPLWSEKLLAAVADSTSAAPGH